MNKEDLSLGIVATAPSPATSGTSLILQAGQGADFPAAPFKALAYPPGVVPSRSNAERITVTAKSTDTLTITRAQGVTTAKSIATGWIISNNIFADDFISGELGYAEVIAGQSGITSTTDLTGLSITITVPTIPTGKYFWLEGYLSQMVGSSGSRGDLRIREGSTDLHVVYGDTSSVTYGSPAVNIKKRFATAPSAGSHTYKLSLAAGVGNTGFYADGNSPAFIRAYIE